MAITVGILTGGANSHTTSSEEANAYGTDFVSEGVVGTFTNTAGVAPATGAFAVNATGTPDSNIQVSSGVAYVTGTPTSQNSQTFRVKNSSTATVAISANSSGSTKYDWVYIKLDATKLNAPAVGADDVATIATSRSSSASSDDGTPPTYGYPIAVVTVANGFSTITNGNIRDIRTNCIVNLGSSSVSSGWTDLGYTPNTITYNSNRSYDLVFNSTDLTSTISNGMRLKLSRLVSAPTRCTSLNGTNQYYSKSSPAGTTFTDDFVVSAWVKLSSYPSADSGVVSRYNGTSGWIFYIDTSGRVVLGGYNGGAGNNSKVISSQSIPLNKWVHIAAQLDMSSFTATTTTSYIMFDGLDTPASVTRGGTNPTALIQAGNLEIGSFNAGGFLPGKIAQAAYFNAKVTQATIRTYISQGLAGTETSLVSAYSFDNSINDLSSNANNLTANNSAVATNADSPFAQDDNGTPTGSTDVAIIQANSFSTNTTITVQVPEGCTIPTSGGISAIAYSTQKMPFGFPANQEKWTVLTLNTLDSVQSSPVNGTWYNPNTISLTIPVGAWQIAYMANLNWNTSGAQTDSYAAITLSTANNSESDVELSCWGRLGGASGTLRYNVATTRMKGLTLSSATPYYLNIKSMGGAISTIGTYGLTGATIVRAVNAYL